MARITREPALPEPFRKITIVLETEAEARALWHRLNAPNMLFDSYAKDRKRNIAESEGWRLFEQLDDLYRPATEPQN